MLVHTVLFWLKDDIQENQIGDFRTGLEALKQIKSAETIYVGSPADTPPRPEVLVSNYNFCLTVILKDIKAHDTYQVDPIHKKFIETYSSYWEKVRVYDAD